MTDRRIPGRPYPCPYPCPSEIQAPDLQNTNFDAISHTFISFNQIMKAILLTTALAAFGLAVLPLHADDATAKPLVEEAVAQTTPVYLIHVSGAG